MKLTILEFLNFPFTFPLLFPLRLQGKSKEVSKIVNFKSRCLGAFFIKIKKPKDSENSTKSVSREPENTVAAARVLDQTFFRSQNVGVLQDLTALLDNLTFNQAPRLPWF